MPLDRSESGRGHLSPARFFASSGPAIAESIRRGTRKEISMNPLIQLQKAAPVFVVMLVCVGLLPKTQAVSPPPPRGLSQLHHSCGGPRPSGSHHRRWDIALGTFSLFSVTTGSFNTAVGAGALDLNTADSNTATGAAALLFNTTGTENTANETAALEFNATGDFNTANGAFALFNNMEGANNTAVGASALFSNTTGEFNNVMGFDAMADNVSDAGNVAIGDSAGCWC